MKGFYEKGFYELGEGITSWKCFTCWQENGFRGFPVFSARPHAIFFNTKVREIIPHGVEKFARANKKIPYNCKPIAEGAKPFPNT